MQLQLESLFAKFDELQIKHGDEGLLSIYGAGNITSPEVMLIFMNPTARNIASFETWGGLRAPWIGTRTVWKFLSNIDLVESEHMVFIEKSKSDDWTPDFAAELYSSIASKGFYITNFAKCTMQDARPLSNKLFMEYRSVLEDEINAIKPRKIVTFGNQVSSCFLERSISVSNYTELELEEIEINGNEYPIYPTYYPVGQGRRNMPIAEKRLRLVLDSN